MTTAIDAEMAILLADASGVPVRLEYVRGRMKVEASPAARHQKTAKRIERSIVPIPGSASGCNCFYLSDVLIRFPDLDGSLKRPDIAIFCEEPADTDQALEDVLPVAVIEIMSLGYEDKDIGQDGAPFYLGCGVPDVIVVDPRSKIVRYYQQDQPIQTAQSPVTLDLQCGCRVTV